MALKDNFYSDIFDVEQVWIDRISNGLLNPVYCKLVLRPFYVEKKSKLEEEYELLLDEGNKLLLTADTEKLNELTKRKNMLSGIIVTLSDIIGKIDLFDKQYKESKSVDMKSLIPLFLTSQMNNIGEANKKVNSQGTNAYKENSELTDKINRLQIRKQILEDEIKNYSNTSNDDYLYDDFEEEQTKNSLNY